MEETAGEVKRQVEEFVEEGFVKEAVKVWDFATATAETAARTLGLQQAASSSALPANNLPGIQWTAGGALRRRRSTRRRTQARKFTRAVYNYSNPLKQRTRNSSGLETLTRGFRLFLGYLRLW